MFFAMMMPVEVKSQGALRPPLLMKGNTTEVINMKETEVRLFPDLSEVFFLAELTLIKNLITGFLERELPGTEAQDVFREIKARSERMLSR